jgi:hypothetical protein
MAISSAPFVPAPLTRLDHRCDRCNAAAMLRATLPSGGELQFCSHHARTHGPRLLEIGADLTSAI